MVKIFTTETLMAFVVLGAISLVVGVYSRNKNVAFSLQIMSFIMAIIFGLQI